MGIYAHTLMNISNVKQKDVPSLWIVLELGEAMMTVTTLMRAMKMKDAAYML